MQMLAELVLGCHDSQRNVCEWAIEYSAYQGQHLTDHQLRGNANEPTVTVSGQQRLLR